MHPPGLDAALVSLSVAATLEAIAAALPGGRFGGFDGLRVIITGLEVATMNGVWALGDTANPAELRRGLNAVASAEVPFGVQARPECAHMAADAAEELGLVALPAPVPLMATTSVAPPPAIPDLVVRRLAGEELTVHGTLAAAAFDAPAELFDSVTRPVLALPGSAAFVGEVAGTPVTTSLLVAHGGGAGIFNVATPSAHRGHGYGSAVAAHAAAAALDAGARVIWLQASEQGEAIYERLGFATLERWSCWVTG